MWWLFLTDSGIVCLSVLSRTLAPPDNATELLNPEGGSEEGGVAAGVRNHNYTECCARSNVSASCFGFCNIQSILDGNTGQDPEHCEADFPDIVRCMAGRSTRHIRLLSCPSCLCPIRQDTFTNTNICSAFCFSCFTAFIFRHYTDLWAK